MAKEMERFASFKQKCVVDIKIEQRDNGKLIFDEVKVIMWNSRSQKVIGLAMSPDDMSPLIRYSASNLVMPLLWFLLMVNKT